MNRLSELLSKATPEKATANEVDELSELTGFKLPQQIFDVMQTAKGLINSVWIIQKRNNLEITKDEISKMITLDNDIEIGYEMLFLFTRLTRDQITEIRKTAESANDPNIHRFTTEDYKEFTKIVEEANKFMKSNKFAKFSAVITCEFVPLEEKENPETKNGVKTETPS